MKVLAIVTQVSIFSLLFYLILQYNSYRKGMEFTEGVKKPVRMYRDSKGIPHIEATTIEDAYFAVGFSQAEDRLWQLYFYAKLGEGTLTELFGDIGDTLDVDIYSRLLNFRDACTEVIGSLNEETMAQLKAYSDGINHYAETMTTKPLEFHLLGIDFDGWKVEYSCYTMKFLEIQFAHDYVPEIIRTYLKESINLSEEVINQIYPFHASNHQGKTTVTNSEEVKKSYDLLGSMFKKPEATGQKKNANTLRKEAEVKPQPQVESKNENEREIKPEDLVVKQHKIDSDLDKELEERLKEFKHKKIKIDPTKGPIPLNQDIDEDEHRRNRRTEKVEERKGNFTIIDGVEYETVIISKKDERRISRDKLIGNKHKNSIIGELSLDDLEFKGEKVKKATTFSEIKNNSTKIREDLNNYNVRDVDDDDEAEAEEMMKSGSNHVGSNNCIISGKYTTNGSPFMCNDPHLFNTIPVVWYLVNIKVKEGDYHFVGATLIGTPGLFVGTNSHISYGLTVAHTDTADIIRLKRAGKGSNKYILDGKEHELSTRKEVFYMGRDRKKKTERTYYVSKYGVVLNGFSVQLLKSVGTDGAFQMLDEDNYFYIMRPNYISNDHFDLEAIITYPLAKNLQEVREKIRNISISINVVITDRENNIAYMLSGRIPKKTRVGELSYITTAETSKDLEFELIPFDEMPFVLNPERGYVVTANNPIIDNFDYAIQGFYATDGRAASMSKAIEELIASGVKIDHKTLNEKVLKNVYDAHYKDITSAVKRLVELDKSLQIKPATIPFFKEMTSFDGKMTKESRGALLFNVFETELYQYLHFGKLDNKKYKKLRNIVLQSLTIDNYLLYKLNQYNQSPELCYREYSMSCAKFLLNVFEVALESIETLLGTNQENWKWTNLNVKHFEHHPLSLMPFVKMFAHKFHHTDGNRRTPKISYPKVYKKNYRGIISSNLKMIVNLRDMFDNSSYSSDTGQSERLLSKYYTNLLESHENGDLMKFDRHEKEYTLTFNPKKK